MNGRCGNTATIICMMLAASIPWGAPSIADTVDYRAHIKPLLAEKCYSCHGRLKRESDLRLETRSFMMAGNVIVPGHPDDSEILRRVTAESDERMPPPHEGSALKSDEIGLLRRWIAEGAIAPDEEVPDSPLEHWAFKRITRPAIPTPAADLVPNHPADRGTNPVDAFLDEQRASASLQVQPEADRGILLRRLYLDLIGLPPTLAQLRDGRPWEQIVDALLANPQHGERWGRHWMDIWRYSDWYGLGAQLRYSQKHLWHWRDWIIESLNQDKGYDRMIREMLAADEIAPLDSGALRATGFLARNYYLFNRTTWLDSTIEHTSKAFLGLTVNCAKCHDHKYDPITQLDYYRMRAIFEPHQVRLDPLAGEVDFEKNGLPRVFDDHTELRTYVHLRGNPKTPDKETVIEPGVPAFLAAFQSVITPVPLPYQAYAPGVRDYVQRDRIRIATAAVEAARTALAEKQSETERTLLKAQLEVAEAKLAALTVTIIADRAKYRDTADTESCRALAKQAALFQAKSQVAVARLGMLEAEDDDEKKKTASTQLAKAESQLAAAQRGEIEYTSLRGAKKALESPAHKEEDYPETYATVSTGRRRALAEWITSKQNPLTARVAVNHVWLRHFGQPLVDSVFDFGLRAPRPANAKLLDYLAHEFMESGWSLRQLHRVLVTSQTYRLRSSAAGADAATRAADPSNQFYWRMNTRRMESQVVRDSLLQLAGELDPVLGGPSVDAHTDSNRRSLYYTHSRDDQHKFLKMFDDADFLQCYRRSESVVPQQALALVNSELSLRMAEKVAERLWDQLLAGGSTGRSPGLREYCTVTFEALLARAPTNEELDACVRFFEELRAVSQREAPRRERARFVHALLNHNDFISIR